MKRKTILAQGLIALLALFALSVPAHAADAIQVLQTSVNAQTLTIFMDTALPLDGLDCKVSNQAAEIMGAGTVADGDAVVKTTVLVDISTSIPTNMRSTVISAIDKLIEQKSPSDEFKLVTFGEEETVLCDFTADRYDLGKTTQLIAFNGQSSMIYDAIYNTIPAAGGTADVPTLYRTIVITDGVDLTNIGVTMEELFLKLQSERYPVYVLAVSAAAAGTANKELSAITRISGGRYCALDPSTDISALGQVLGVGNYSCLEVQVPEPLLDGSVRQVDLTVGGSSLSFDVKFPATYTQPEPVESAPPEPTPTPTPEPTAEPEPTPVPTPEPAAEPEPSFIQQYGVILICVAVVGVVLIVVLVVFLQRRKKPSAPVAEPIPPAAGSKADIETKTVPFLDDAQYTIKISAPKHPGKEWVLGIADEILIGRADNCHIQLEESTVSRIHCKIVLRGDQLELVHTGSNRTLLNGEKVTVAALNSGDLLDLGREQLRVDYIQKVDSGRPGGDPDNGTKSLF